MTKTALRQKPSHTASADILPVQRITALWALSEAALGGVLHAFRLPFTGLFMSAVAVLLITMLGMFSHRRGVILKATVIVLIVKGVVSPHTPITAYGAVFLQGLIGEIAFRMFQSPKKAALFLGILSLLLSALQKFLILTVVFGMAIWRSLDLFGTFVVKEILPAAHLHSALPISMILILIYVLLHLAAGIAAGIVAPRVSARIFQEYSAEDFNMDNLPQEDILPQHKKRHRRWLRRASAYLVFGMALGIVILSYIVPVFEKNHGLQALIMIVRSLIIMGIWYFMLAPIVRRRIHSYLDNKKSAYAEDVQAVLLILPLFRKIVTLAWRSSAEFNGLARWKRFIFILLMKTLTVRLAGTELKSNR